MISSLDLFKAEGKAEGEAKAAIATILSCVHDGDLLRVRGEVRLRHLAEQGAISSAQLAEALAALR